MSMLENLQRREKLPDGPGPVYSLRFVTKAASEYPGDQTRMVYRTEPREWFIPEELAALKEIAVPRPSYNRTYVGTERVLQYGEWFHRAIKLVSSTVAGLPSPFSHQPEQFRLRTIDHAVRPDEFSSLLHATEIVLERQTTDETAMRDIAAVMFQPQWPDSQLFVVRDRDGEWVGMEPGAQCDYVMQRMMTLADLATPERPWAADAS